MLSPSSKGTNKQRQTLTQTYRLPDLLTHMAGWMKMKVASQGDIGQIYQCSCWPSPIKNIKKINIHLTRMVHICTDPVTSWWQVAIQWCPCKQSPPVPWCSGNQPGQPTQPLHCRPQTIQTSTQIFDSFIGPISLVMLNLTGNSKSMFLRRQNLMWCVMCVVSGLWGL